MLRAAPLEVLCRLGEEKGVGDKALLREVVAGHLGLPRAARLVKRAIQFGARVATRGQRGTDAVAHSGHEGGEGRAGSE